jgi:hypothetical protein
MTLVLYSTAALGYERSHFGDYQRGRAEEGKFPEKAPIPITAE